MSSSLLNNFSLGLVEGLPETTEGLELSDEVTQVLFGSLEGLEDEKSQVRVRARFGALTPSLVSTMMSSHGRYSTFWPNVSQHVSDFSDLYSDPYSDLSDNDVSG